MLEPRTASHQNSSGSSTKKAGGWTGAVSRRSRPTSTLSPTSSSKKVTHVRDESAEGNQALSTSKQDEGTGASLGDDVSSPKLHTTFGHSAEIKALNETMSYVIEDYKPPSKKSLREPKPLPLGKTATKELQTMLAKTKRPIKSVGPPNKKKEAKPMSEADAKRARRIASQRKFDQWRQRKDADKAAERARRKAEAQQKAELRAGLKTSSRDGAHAAWLDRKRKEAARTGPKFRKRSIFAGATMTEEFTAGVRRNRFEPSDVQPIFEELLALLDTSGNGRVDRTGFTQIIEQVELQRRVQRAMQQIIADREANPLPVDKTEWTPELRTTMQKLAQRQRIGERILMTCGMSLKAIVKFCNSATKEFRKIDSDCTGSLKEEEFKGVLKNLNLGVSATDQVEIIKLIRGNEGERIEYARFVEWIAEIEARRRLGPPAVVFKPSRALELAERLCAFHGTDGARDIFETCISDSRLYRKAVNEGQCGWINIKQFKAALSTIDDRLPLHQRKDLHKALESYCRSIDADGDGVVETTRVDLFLRKIEIELTAKEAHDSIPADIRRRNDVKFRYWKIAITNYCSHSGMAFDQMAYEVSNAVTSPDPENKFLMWGEFMPLMKTLGLGLSTVQIDELGRVYLVESEQAGISRAALIQDLIDAEQKLRTISARKSDARHSLASSIFRSLGHNVSQLPKILSQYQAVLMTWDAADQDTRRRTSNSSVSLSLPADGEVGAGPQANDFDVTWGNDSETNLPIHMPPGSAKTPENFGLQVVTSDT